MPSDVDVAIVGAGAAGLFLAARLAADGASVAVLEARDAPTRHSRAIGIHPPGLAALDAVGVAERLVGQGVEVRRGHAFAGDARGRVRRLGTLDFAATLPAPWPFVLTVPQHRTEAILERRLVELAPGALQRGVRVQDWSEDGDGVTVGIDGGGARSSLRASLLVDASGASGDGARRAGVRRRGGRYGDAYLMADLPPDAGPPFRDLVAAADAELAPDPDGRDRTYADSDASADADSDADSDAAIFLCAAGVVEAFPLPDGARRWVVKTDRLRGDADARDLATLLRARVGARLDPDRARMVSAFGVERRLADRLAVGRIWLCGDAAHVVAPIGGQGMTLGWLGAETIARELAAWRAGERGLAEAATRYDSVQRARARRAIARGAWNVRLGRATRWGGARAMLVRTMLTPPLDRRMARLFTMQT